jgi:opacity protein-like surface antigen
MSSVNTSSALRLLVAVAALSLGLSTPARAQTYLVAFGGTNVGPDTGCSSNCGSRPVTLGGVYGYFEQLFGFETDFGYTQNAFPDGEGSRSRVITLMTNLSINPKVGAARLYALGGLGFIRSKVEVSPSTAFAGENGGFGWDVGAGIVVAKEKSIGIRGDWRYIRGFSDLRALGFPLTGTNLSFNRFTVGLVVNLTRN